MAVKMADGRDGYSHPYISMPHCLEWWWWCECSSLLAQGVHFLRTKLQKMGSESDYVWSDTWDTPEDAETHQTMRRTGMSWITIVLNLMTGASRCWNTCGHNKIDETCHYTLKYQNRLNQNLYQFSIYLRSESKSLYR